MGFRCCQVRTRVSGVGNRGGMSSGKQNLDSVSHAHEASKDAA